MAVKFEKVGSQVSGIIATLHSDFNRQVKEGQTVRFSVDAYPERDFLGKVSQIRLSPQITNNVVTYPVIVEVANADLKLLPGMTADVRVQVAQLENALRVPASALRVRPELRRSDRVPVREPRGRLLRDLPRGEGGAAGPDRGAALRVEGRRNPGREATAPCGAGAVAPPRRRTR